MSNLQTYYNFQLDLKKVDQHTGGKWLIHGTKRHKDNRLQSLAQQDFIQKIYIQLWFKLMRDVYPHNSGCQNWIS